MVITVKLNNNKAPEPLAEAIQPLQSSKAAQAMNALQGTKLPEGQRMDTLEIQNRENAEPVVKKYPNLTKEDYITVLQPYHFLNDIDGYLGKFEQFAKGEIGYQDFQGYIAGFEREVSSALGYNYGGWKFVEDLVDEMKQKLENGVANTLDNLKTKFTVTGKEFSYKEVLGIAKTGNYLEKVLQGNHALGYDDYMRMGFARAYVYKPELNLTDDQREVLRQASERHINVKLENNKYWLEIAAAEEQNDRWKGYYIGGQTAVASNTQIISGILKAFSEYDPKDKNSFLNAVNKCQELMRPWSERCAGYIATQCPGYASYYVQEKADLSRKYYLSLWEGKML